MTVTTEEGNNLIIKFLGLRIDCHPNSSDCWIVDKNIKSQYHNEPLQCARFETSWDWLMPVYKKYRVFLEENDIKYHNEKNVLWLKHKGLIQTTLLLGDINKFWSALVEFIKFYNQNKTT